MTIVATLLIIATEQALTHSPLLALHIKSLSIINLV